jgi:hypothetical protein
VIASRDPPLTADPAASVLRRNLRLEAYYLRLMGTYIAAYIVLR